MKYLMNGNNSHIFLTVPEAAEFLRIPESTFRHYVARRYKNIPLIKIGKRIIFKKDLLEDWMERQIILNKS